MDDQREPEKRRTSMFVVFPIHGGDALQAIHHARWMEVMTARTGLKYVQPALIVYDPTLNPDVLKAFKEALSNSFKTVLVHRYPRPRESSWPAPANWAWQHTAQHMTQLGSWLWMEADAIALKPSWLDEIETAYHQSGMPFMGPKVKGMSHVNGCAVYPQQTPELLPIAMRSTSMAWDYEAGPEMIHRTQDASDLMQHVWSVDNSKWLECGGGQVPMLVTKEELEQNLKSTAVFLHRVKDNSVTDLLLRGEFVP